MPARKRILLLIDDEQQQLSLHEMVLELSGYTVLAASSGRQGLALLSSHHVDEVLLDYEMPEMDGGMVAAEIKKTHPELPILMLSGHGALPETALQFVNGFVSKGNAPIFLQQLLGSDLLSDMAVSILKERFLALHTTSYCGTKFAA